MEIINICKVKEGKVAIVFHEMFRFVLSNNITGEMYFQIGKRFLLKSVSLSKLQPSYWRMASNSSGTNKRRERLVWVDCEMTGLDPEKDTLLEVAAIVTEGDLQIVEEGPNLGWSTSFLTVFCYINQKLLRYRIDYVYHA